MNTIIWITGVTAIATIVNAVALICDVYYRHKTKRVTFVQVPNKNEGGYEEYRTENSTIKHGVKSKNIVIHPDSSVEIEPVVGSKLSYARFIKWHSK